MTNVSTTVTELAPMGGATLSGYKIGLLASTAKAAQNDTITITNASAVVDADLRVVATGAAENNTLATNVITCTSATTGSIRGIVYYR